MKSCQLSILAILLFFFTSSVQASMIVEDFTTLNHADLQASTAIWNIVDHSARSRAYANATVDATRPIDFGDGSDGIVNSSAGYTFNTDTHPNGYQFQSLTISAGVITVTGSHPLIIRSLSNITITPDLKVNGAGQTAITCLANGGAGGSATVAAGSAGGDGFQSDGVTSGDLSFGIGQTMPVGYNILVNGQGSVTGGPGSNNFESAANFICGTGGPGGGGYTNGVTFGSGGVGGAGGGAIKIVSLGDLSLGIIEAKGGNGGNGLRYDLAPNRCSGNGSGGNGGVIFLQTLGTLSSSVDPDVSGGDSGTSDCELVSVQALPGFTRGDSSSTSVKPAWATAAGSYDSDIVPALLTSYVQSKSYDLGTLNAGFLTPTLTTVPGAGSVSVAYAGSIDGVTFSGFTADISTLSNLGYRFVKFRVTFTNPGAPGAAPKISKVTIPFSELGLEKLNIKLSPGCGTIQKIKNRKPNSDAAGAASTLLWLSIWAVAFRVLKTKSLGM